MTPDKKSFTKQKTDTLHILGNGPSIQQFVRSSWPDDHMFVGCNFSNIEHRPDFTVMMDAKPVMKFYQGYKLQIPLVLSDRAVSYIDNDRSGWQELSDDAFELIDIIPMIHKKAEGMKFPMNSGHHATMYAVGYNDPKARDVHLWGMDIFCGDNLVTATDAILENNRVDRHKTIVAQEWRTYWKQIFDMYPSIRFRVHVTGTIDKFFDTTENLYNG